MEKSGGIFLGRFEGKDLSYQGENSVLVLAPPGAGKSTCLAAPHLLRSNKSTIVLDPKLELYATTANARRAMGHRVLVICPWHESLSEEFGGRVELHDDGFDPCSFLNAESSNVIDDCTLLASLLLPEPSKAGSSNDDFWRDFGISILVAFMLLELSRKGSVTLPRLRRMIMADDDAIIEDITEMMVSEAFSGVLAEYGARIYSPKVNAPKEYSAGLSTAMKALRLYDAHGPLGRSVEKAGVDFSTFKDQPTTVYIGAPSDKAETHKAWMGMTTTLAMEMLARDRRKRPCVMLLDEFQNIGIIQPILKGIALYRGSGLQFVLLVQFLPALKRLAGESFREFLSVDVVCAFGAPSDIETLELLSKLSGSTTQSELSYSSDAERLAGGAVGTSLSSREIARPLIRPEEIRMLDKDKALIFVSNLPPILATKESYLSNRKLRKRADPNPYYE